VLNEAAVEAQLSASIVQDSDEDRQDKRTHSDSNSNSDESESQDLGQLLHGLSQIGQE
jgi:hypothetical protein